MSDEPKTWDIFLALPHGGAVEPMALPGLTFASERHRVTLTPNGCSLLAHNFNRLYCAALEQRAVLGLTHFAMHHSDIEAPPGWLDVLLGEMDRLDADVVGVPVAIKDDRGLTSTGLQDPETLKITRFTMAEIHALPETFDAAAAGHPDKHLMINTGLWVMRFAEPWVEEVCFEVRDAIVRTEDGKFSPRVLPEDWNFSGWLARAGKRVFLTRKVRAVHYGKAAFSNGHVWGACQTDPGDHW